MTWPAISACPYVVDDPQLGGRANFDSFIQATMLVFQVLTLEAGPARCYLPHHQTHIAASSLELDGLKSAWTAMGGHLRVLMWAREHGCDWDAMSVRGPPWAGIQQC